MLTDDVKATIRAGLKALRHTRLIDLWYFGIDPDIQDKKVDAALAWLDEQPQQWEPLPDGEYGNLDTVVVSGNTITICSALGVGVRRHSAMLDLPDNIRLCKRA